MIQALSNSRAVCGLRLRFADASRISAGRGSLSSGLSSDIFCRCSIGLPPSLHLATCIQAVHHGVQFLYSYCKQVALALASCPLLPALAPHLSREHPATPGTGASVRLRLVSQDNVAMSGALPLRGSCKSKDAVHKKFEIFARQFSSEFIS